MSERYTARAADIPWSSWGRETPLSRVAKSLLPVGVLPYDAEPINDDALEFKTNEDSDREDYLINITGTCIQAGPDKLVTCGHVARNIAENTEKSYILASLFRNGEVMYVPYPIYKALRYIDPRTNKVNYSVDLAVLIVPARSTSKLPYEVPSISWGDSASLGVGDEVAIGGFGHGTDLFTARKSNRGVVQPSFSKGIISSIIPATTNQETRILQIDTAAPGGMSGGAVIDPQSGSVLGLITSCVHIDEVPQPISFALPSEVIVPYTTSISVGDRKKT